MDRNMATGELWMREAVKEMMVKHLGFGASVGTNWMLLESDLVAIIAGHAPEQEWEAKEKALLELVNQQAEDEGLWFDATTAPEAYLQQELRKLHVAIEGKSIGEAILNREQEKL